MTNEKAREADLAVAKSITHDWLAADGVALTGTNGEVSRSTVNRFKLSLQRRILDALATVRAEERETAFTAIGVELRRYGANIRKVDLMERFQQLFRELQVND